MNSLNWSAACPTNIVSPVTTPHPAAAASLQQPFGRAGRHRQGGQRWRAQGYHSTRCAAPSSQSQRCRRRQAGAQQGRLACSPEEAGVQGCVDRIKHQPVASQGSRRHRRLILLHTAGAQASRQAVRHAGRQACEQMLPVQAANCKLPSTQPPPVTPTQLPTCGCMPTDVVLASTSPLTAPLARSARLQAVAGGSSCSRRQGTRRRAVGN